MRLRSLAAFALVAAACGRPTSVRLHLAAAPSDAKAAPLTLSVFDPHRAVARNVILGDRPLPLVAVAYNLPATAETLRLVVTRQVTPVERAGHAFPVTPGGESDVTLTLSASTPDGDGDGIPDNVDNCPTVANPDQASATGLSGDACAGGNDLSAGLDAAPVDLAPPPDLTTAGDMAGLVAQYHFSYTLPAHQSLYYGGHDKPPATITFSSTADSVTCSHDGGKTFAACDSKTTIVFTPDDYTSGATLQLKLLEAGLPPLVVSLNPSQLMPGLGFFNCDQVVTSESAIAFTQRLADDRVLCLASGATISIPISTDMHVNPSGLKLDNVNLKLLGIESARPIIRNLDSGGNQGIFLGTARTGRLIVSNLELDASDGNVISFDQNAGNNVFSYVAAATTGCCDEATQFGGGLNTLYNSTIHVEGSGATPAMHLYGGANVVMTKGAIYGRDDTTAVLVESGALTMTGVSIDNSGTTGNPVNPTVSFIKGSGHFDGCTLITTNIALKIAGATIVLDNTMFKRADLAGMSSAAIGVFGTSPPNTGSVINSTVNGNHFCDANPAGSNRFATAIARDVTSGGLYGGTFVLANQVNMGMVDGCP